MNFSLVSSKSSLQKSAQRSGWATKDRIDYKWWEIFQFHCAKLLAIIEIKMFNLNAALGQGCEWWFNLSVYFRFIYAAKWLYYDKFRCLLIIKLCKQFFSLYDDFLWTFISTQHDHAQLQEHQRISEKKTRKNIDTKAKLITLYLATFNSHETSSSRQSIYYLLRSRPPAFLTKFFFGLLFVCASYAFFQPFFFATLNQIVCHESAF